MVASNRVRASGDREAQRIAQVSSSRILSYMVVVYSLENLWLCRLSRFTRKNLEKRRNDTLSISRASAERLEMKTQR